MKTLEWLTVYAIPLVLAITLHEAAHAFAARWFGDDTAWRRGRMTLNPLRHIDPLWTVIVPLGLILVGSPFVLGAAKPVPVNFAALKNPKRDAIWVAAAGPLANLAMSISWVCIAKIGLGMESSMLISFATAMALAGVFVNVLLMIFNLLPVLPLDGGRILAGLMPDFLAKPYFRLEPYGLFVVVGLMFTPLFEVILLPLVDRVVKAVYSIAGIL